MAGVYQAGIEALGQQRYRLPSPEAIAGQLRQKGLGFLGTPGEVRAKARSLDTAAHNLHRAVLGYTPRPEDAAAWHSWKQGWVEWLAALQALVNEIKDGVHWGMGAALQEYETALAKWRTDFETRWRAPVQAPPLATPAPNGNGDTFWHRFGLGVAVTLAVGAVVYALKEGAGRG